MHIELTDRVPVETETKMRTLSLSRKVLVILNDKVFSYSTPAKILCIDCEDLILFGNCYEFDVSFVLFSCIVCCVVASFSILFLKVLLIHLSFGKSHGQLSGNKRVVVM